MFFNLFLFRRHSTREPASTGSQRQTGYRLWRIRLHDGLGKNVGMPLFGESGTTSLSYSGKPAGCTIQRFHNRQGTGETARPQGKGKETLGFTSTETIKAY